MGNRAVIQFGKSDNAMGIYLHWNGGYESVKAFLDAAKHFHVSEDSQYTPARLCQIIGNFMGGTLSLGIDIRPNLDTDNGDNGTFIVNEALEIIEREHYRDTTPFDQTYYDAVLAQTIAKNTPHFKESE